MIEFSTSNLPGTKETQSNSCYDNRQADKQRNPIYIGNDVVVSIIIGKVRVNDKIEGQHDH